MMTRRALQIIKRETKSLRRKNHQIIKPSDETEQMTTAMEAVLFFLVALHLAVPIQVAALGGSASTIAVVYSGNVTVCGIKGGRQSRGITCWRGDAITDVFPSVSFDYLAGGRDVFCGLISGGFSLLCFDSRFTAKRLYFNRTVRLKDLTVGEDQICALTNGTRNARCWRGGRIPPTFSSESDRFISMSSGVGFSCGVLMNSNRVVCRGNDGELAGLIETEFINSSMNNINAGGNFACGLNLAGFIDCRGRNESGQLNVPENSALRYSSLALGNRHGCAIRRSNGSVVCWGNLGEDESWRSQIADRFSFESLVAGFDFTCGLLTSNLSVVCWGVGWPTAEIVLPLGQVLPGPCVQSDCGDCGVYPQSQSLCFSSGNICRACSIAFPPTPNSNDTLPPPPPVSSPSSHSRGLRKGMLAFAIIGSVGTFSGICTLIYCLWTGVCCGNKKIHNSVQPTTAATNSTNGRASNNNISSRSSTFRRQGSRIMRRQRSGTSSVKYPDRAEEFSFQELSTATNNFSLGNKIGAGSFGVVYRGKLWDGREVAIKRGDTEEQAKKFQETESAFDSEIAFLSRLHHKHLVGLVGYCEEREERLLVYEYMKNGALYDHIHHKDNVDKESSLINSWKLRISVSLDAARGIEYLHNYAVPPIIHRDIKSSNILLDSNWTARVSDFGLSLMGPNFHSKSQPPIKAAGTVGYIDPEYYGLNVLTAKSDVYGLGVVLLELLTGKRAIFKNGGGDPMSLVDYAVPAINVGEMERILDSRVGAPVGNETEAVELVAYAAVQCVNREGKDRPTMADMVTNLERALAMLDDSHGSLSSGPMSAD